MGIIDNKETNMTNEKFLEQVAKFAKEGHNEIDNYVRTLDDTYYIHHAFDKLEELCEKFVKGLNAKPKSNTERSTPSTAKKYKILQPGNTVCISLEELFNTIHNGDVHTTDCGHEIVCTVEDDGSAYFDLRNGVTDYACCDGEECEVKSVAGSVVTFINKNQEEPQEFKLTIRECETAIFGLK